MVMDVKKMYPDGHHPREPSHMYDHKKRAQHFSRMLVPPRVVTKICHMIWRDRTPEYKADVPCHPFASDVFLLGNMVWLQFLDGDPEFEHSAVHGFECLRPLVNNMIQDDPEKQPQMDKIQPLQ
ncbi:hypothetical protein BDP27DRAFT_1424382 [Rhodocollybia butyracea]|uniref:Uncharacterized protein n=1 Tax=Rhodocollybia butyracea TaxID=206335 RepID=A0A9P5PPQ7_9AGAR|nr:hypothetical protein BDP27DRAFT_1424382 [Rhodocollybia butyracea]